MSPRTLLANGLDAGDVLGMVAAVAAACLFGVAAVVQAHGVRRSEAAMDTLAGFVRGAVRNPLLLLVVAAYLGGFVLHAVSIWYLPLYLAQATVALSLPVTALTARRLRERLGIVEWAAIAAIVVGLALVVAGSDEPGESRSSVPLAVALWVGVSALVVAVRLHPPGRPSTGLAAGILGAIAGLGYAGSAIAVRGVSLPLDVPVAGAALAVPSYGLVAFWVYSVALGQAAVVSSSAPLVVGQTLVPALVGILALGDSMRAGWAVGVCAGMALAAGGALVLGRATASPGLSEGGSAAERRGLGGSRT